MAEIFVCGHGDWGTIGRSSVFVNLPTFTEVLLYKEVGDVLLVSEAEDILSRSKKALQPARVLRSYEHCPDLSLHPAPEFWKEFGSAAKKGGVEWLAVAKETSLSDIVSRWHTRIHWIACSVRALR